MRSLFLIAMILTFGNEVWATGQINEQSYVCGLGGFTVTALGGQEGTCTQWGKSIRVSLRGAGGSATIGAAVLTFSGPSDCSIYGEYSGVTIEGAWFFGGQAGKFEDITGRCKAVLAGVSAGFGGNLALELTVSPAE